MNIAVLSCKKIKDESCIGCHRCLTAFDKKEGEFEKYSGNGEVKLKGLVHCGDCPGGGVIVRLMQLKTWMLPFGESIDQLHIGTCLQNHCPHVEKIVETVKAKAGVPVILGTHPYKPVQVWGE
jgi:predicted metal-binding protein